MTDRLQHRISTGSLGGDQDERDVQELINALAYHQMRDAEFLEQQESMTRALAQKTRECGLLRLNHPFGAMYDALQKAEKRELEALAELDECRAQVEQLQRQVAELSKPVTDEEWRIWHLRENYTVGLRAATDALLASRARTK